MPITKGTMDQIAQVSSEVTALIKAINKEIATATRYEWDSTNGYSGNKVRLYPDGKPPASARPYSSSKNTSALRRRSMDLTRLLAELRRS
jgi:hypothetical protein